MCVLTCACVDGGAGMFKNVTSYLGECVAAHVLRVCVCAVCVCGVYVRACGMYAFARAVSVCELQAAWHMRTFVA